ncbi:MAG TPA: DUF2934 domain-containing protein [bacterium]|nr:DUF2934 domain-containing protein [bacterium]
MKRTVDRKMNASSTHGETRSDRETCIAVTAYYMAEKRNFAFGHALNDWLAAEIRVDAPAGPPAR